MLWNQPLNHWKAKSKSKAGPFYWEEETIISITINYDDFITFRGTTTTPLDAVVSDINKIVIRSRGWYFG